MTGKRDIKKVVKEKYGKIAVRSEQNQSCCCCSGSAPPKYSVFSENYGRLDGYVPEADLGLGCGIPTKLAGIREGDTVVDLGSGAGNDIFVARSIVGDKGRIIGIDMTQEMVDKARRNNEKLGYENMEFHLADIEKMPLEECTADIVISNCVLNLVPDKPMAFREIHRILKPGGRFCISDIVTQGDLPASVRKSAELYAGCVASAVKQEEYLEIIREAGFVDVEIKASKTIEVPDELLKKYLSEDEISDLQRHGSAILSITVTGHKEVRAAGGKRRAGRVKVRARRPRRS
jgi:arsenite methyltransferase